MPTSDVRERRAPDRDDELSRAFSALADPTRRAILTRLATGPATAGELAAPFSISQPAVSQHLKVLERAGLIERRAHAQWRTCALRTEALDDVSQWIERHRSEWNERFDLLENRLKETSHSPVGEGSEAEMPTTREEQS